MNKILSELKTLTLRETQKSLRMLPVNIRFNILITWRTGWNHYPKRNSAYIQPKLILTCFNTLL